MAAARPPGRIPWLCVSAELAEEKNVGLEIRCTPDPTWLSKVRLLCLSDPGFFAVKGGYSCPEM